MFYLTTHSTHFIYGYMASDIWLRTILIVRKETCCRHIDYSFWLTARVLLYAPSHRQDNTYHSLCYTSRGALIGTHHERTLLPRKLNFWLLSLPCWKNSFPFCFSCKDNSGSSIANLSRSLICFSNWKTRRRKKRIDKSLFIKQMTKNYLAF